MTENDQPFICLCILIDNGVQEKPISHEAVGKVPVKSVDVPVAVNPVPAEFEQGLVTVPVICEFQVCPFSDVWTEALLRSFFLCFFFSPYSVTKPIKILE